MIEIYSIRRLVDYSNYHSNFNSNFNSNLKFKKFDYYY